MRVEAGGVCETQANGRRKAEGGRRKAEGGRRKAEGLTPTKRGELQDIARGKFQKTKGKSRGDFKFEI